MGGETLGRCRAIAPGGAGAARTDANLHGGVAAGMSAYTIRKFIYKIKDVM